ncbi:MAG: UDP-N-acetylmuramoyl-L-alanyl-D-glutamate--2,6-diaminopimelate ligase [Oligoflexia bacterium]|nr:UDP-N-acetylmuramoyl-L-alanyl-D-glutamate--2,6-diaminopimelate ligase [Oligoflexia bacterium]
MTKSTIAADIAALSFGRLINLPPDRPIALDSVAYDSRLVQPGGVFVAVRGAKGDGHEFVALAQKRGAALCIVESADVLGNGPGILVPDSRRALSSLAALRAGYPSRELAAIAVTGTNGKTTIHWLLWHCLSQLGLSPIRIGTLGVEAPGVISRSGEMTTPDALQINTDLRSAVAGGCRACVMEASSHALDQHRIDDIAFDVGIFTNLTRDHLDYHSDMESYFRAKRRLFELLLDSPKPTTAAVINIDDDWGARLLREFETSGLRLLSYGESSSADLRVIAFTHSVTGSQLVIENQGKQYQLKTGFIGRHNAYNLAAVFGALIALGVDHGAALKAISACPQVPGRLEAVGTDELGVYVDYAHTPDALANVLRALRSIVQGRLWVVFGCGGDRDKGKRPVMGRIAAELADCVVVTSDNPRTEDPNAIIQDILASGISPAIALSDRREAIHKTLRQAQSGDVVLIAGKGHEDYQVLGTQKVHFSDQEEARSVLRDLLRGAQCKG